MIDGVDDAVTIVDGGITGDVDTALLSEALFR
jgi:hypothetical protein